MVIFSIFFNIKVFCVFSLESPRRGDSYEYTQYTIFNIKKKITLLFFQICSYGVLFQGTQERVRNSRSKRAISVRATEVLLYSYKQCSIDVHETSRCIDVDATFSRHFAFTETTL